jgi:HSP20 family protein
MALQLWNPIREIERFRRDLDSLFDRFFGEHEELPLSKTPAVESFIEGDKLVVRTDLPGLELKDVEVNVTGDILTIKGSREQRKEEKKWDFLHREVSYGSFERRLPLPKGVKAEEIKASYKDGVLELTMPVPRDMTPRKVTIETEANKEPPKSA